MFRQVQLVKIYNLLLANLPRGAKTHIQKNYPGIKFDKNPKKEQVASLEWEIKIMLEEMS